MSLLKEQFLDTIKGEMCIITLFTNLYQISCKSMLDTKVVFEIIAGADETCQEDL